MDKTASLPGRPRAFDLDVALDAAVDAFHRDGLAGTTYEVLERTTGLRRQSLVYAFGDKRALFEAALRRYADRRVDAIVDCLRAPGSPSAGIRAAFAMWLDDARDAAHPGCLLVNTAGEVGRRDEELSETVEAATARLIAAFEDALARARTAGELRTDAEPADLAHMAVAVGDGALLHARSASNAGLAEASFHGFLTTVLR